MNTKGSLVAIILVSIIGLSIIFVSSIKRRPVIVEASAVATETGDSSAGEFSGWDNRPQVNTVISDNGRLIIGTDDGLYVMPYPLSKSKSIEAYQPEKRNFDGRLLNLNSIIPLGDARFTGGDGLFKLDKDYTISLGSYFPGETVNTLLEFSDGLLVGTDRGLWFHCNETSDEIGCADTLLMPNVMVTSLALDQNGLWVGTYGDGLFFYDGQIWRERFLKRDTLAFSFINALEYAYPYLWVGTDQGIYRYNGGAWSQMFNRDSTEAYDVSCIMTSHGTTYIGTENGLLRCEKDTLTNVNNFDGMAIAGLCVHKKNVIVATRQKGIYTYNGKEEIVSPEQLTSQINSEDNKENKVSAGTEPWAIAEGTNH